ncbi:MAG TPA: condensation domain-containing protein, partial [Candidatus Tectomicrobia bacterium]
APTVAGLAARLEAALQAGHGVQAPPLGRGARGGALPLSFAQQRLWVLDQLEPGNPAYNIASAVHLTGALNVAALEASLQEIVRRHEVLRTTFATVAGQPVQVIAPALTLALPVVDLSEGTMSERERRVRQLATAEALRSFDLARGPLFRVCLLRLGEAEHIALFTMHHIVSDEWSLGILVREVGALYAAFCQGQPSPLPELPVQYADFASWQRQWLQGEVLDTQLAYWRQQLGGSLPVLQLPFDRPRPAVPTYQGALHSFTLAPEVSIALKALSQQAGVTVFMTLLAALQTLLQRYAGQDDIIVGTDVANRNRLETEGLIGFFVNHLVLRTDLRDNPPFREVLRRVRHMTLGAYTHQDLPFDRLVGALQPERQLSQTPLFQVLFVFENPSMPTLQLSGLTLSPVKPDLILAKYDLTLFMGNREQSLGGTWRYSTELFDAVTIMRLSEHFVTLLGSITANPDSRLDRLEMLTQAERQQQAIAKRERQEARTERLRSVSRKAVDLSPGLDG